MKRIILKLVDWIKSIVFLPKTWSWTIFIKIVLILPIMIIGIVAFAKIGRYTDFVEYKLSFAGVCFVCTAIVLHSMKD